MWPRSFSDQVIIAYRAAPEQETTLKERGAEKSKEGGAMKAGEGGEVGVGVRRKRTEDKGQRGTGRRTEEERSGEERGCDGRGEWELDA